MPSDTPVLNRCTRVPLVELTRPRDGFICYLDSWWTLTEADEALFFRGHSPQTNGDERTAKHIRDRLYPGLRVVHVPIAYVPNEHQSWKGVPGVTHYANPPLQQCTSGDKA